MLRMQTSHVTPSLRVFISKVITPVVLLAGLLILVYYNFTGVLKTTQDQEDHFHGVITFNQGPFSYQFKQNGGGDRPTFQYNGHRLLSISEWNSSMTVDGVRSNLWDTNHGYSYDEKKQQVFSTTSGDGWQLIQILTLVNDHTATDELRFVARPTRSPGPAHYVIDLAHTNQIFSNPQVKDNTFTAGTLEGDPESVFKQQDPRPNATITLNVKADAAKEVLVKQSNSYLTGPYSAPWTNAVETEYTIDNPTPLQIISLGTETLTLQANPPAPGTPTDIKHP